MKIVVNGRTVDLEVEDTSFETIVWIAWGEVKDPSAYTVTYFGRGSIGGTLTKGQQVGLQPGMVFSAVRTDCA